MYLAGRLEGNPSGQREISCSTKEQEDSAIVTCILSSDVNDVTDNDKNDDPDQLSNSSLHLYNIPQRKLISRIFPPIVAE
ncbi:hypothetical protein PGTUg99_004147 [Puccinia graminis f. sp. tritici]|uniref:Uncharacterized protein n=1 Tax=Puccinia graminis f. sp. tritici TaxID=56615 RepID=A0A5B0SKS2_PUCGR|nr:hypothetical protein PGTUg99_004147 [Puccinia graminis f. sp. tritici]